MKTIDRYILRIFAGAMAATAIFMMGLYLILHYLSHVKHQDEARASFAANGYTLIEGLCRYYFVHMPEIAALFGPYAILFAAMFTLHHLNQNNELVPVFAVGVSKFRVALPIILASFVLSGGLVALREIVIPANAREMVLISRMMRGKGDPKFSKLDLLSDSMGNIFDAGEWDATNLRLNDVWMLPSSSTQLFRFDYLAWREKDGKAEFVPAVGSAMPAERFAQTTDLSLYDIQDERRVTKRSSYFALKRQSEKVPRDRQLAVMKNEHIAYAFTPFVLLLFGLPLAIRGRKRSVFLGLSLCLGLSLAFFTTSLALQRLGAKTESIDPLLCAWLPLILFGSLGLFLFEVSRR